MILLIIILFFICIFAGISEGIMDILNFRYYESVFVKYNLQFWNKDLSWKNKYVEGNKLKKYLYKTLFVFITDGWHLFKSLHTLFLFLMVIFSFLLTINVFIFIGILCLCYLFKKLVFELTYKYCIKK